MTTPSLTFKLMTATFLLGLLFGYWGALLVQRYPYAVPPLPKKPAIVVLLGTRA